MPGEGRARLRAPRLAQRRRVYLVGKSALQRRPPSRGCHSSPDGGAAGGPMPAGGAISDRGGLSGYSAL
eukprot:374396-Pyramimonas_sp.AAC.1